MSSSRGSALGRRAAAGRPKYWQPSIKIRLALMFAVLLASIVLLYWSMTLSIAHDDQRLLGAKMHVLRTMLAQRPDDATLLNEEVDWETGVLGHARYFVQILDRDGRVVAETPGLEQAGIHMAAFVLMVGILVLQFDGFLVPGLLLLQMPLAFTGGAIALLLSGVGLNAIGLIGFLTPIGISLNHGIVLLHRARRSKATGVATEEAVREAVHVRFRPILLS